MNPTQQIHHLIETNGWTRLSGKYAANQVVRKGGVRLSWTAAYPYNGGVRITHAAGFAGGSKGLIKALSA